MYQFGDKSHRNDKFVESLSKCMKLRIRGRSIRCRLTKSEIDRFEETGVIADAVEFGDESPAFRYALHTSVEDIVMRAKLEDKLHIYLDSG